MKAIPFILLISGLLHTFPCSSQTAGIPSKGLIPLCRRVNIQTDTAQIKDIIDGRWAGTGSSKPYAIQKDFTRRYKGQPSYRFELKSEDNTLKGYADGETKGRAELSYCYATTDDFKKYQPGYYTKAQSTKTVYFEGKGHCRQGANMHYRFAIFVPKELDRNVHAIFAQWHGMPDRTLVRTSDGEIRKLTPEEFMELERHMLFKKDKGMEKRMHIKAGGDTVYKAGKPNGWMIEQGGYPPLAFGFASGYFYIKGNSDRKWMSDKSDRCSANPVRDTVMVPVKSKYKESVLLYKERIELFPKEQWVTFDITVKWTGYSGEKETITSSGRADITMQYTRGHDTVCKHIVDNRKVQIGRNDEKGYYFKFGIYRLGGSMVPVCYNLAGYSEEEME